MKNSILHNFFLLFWAISYTIPLKKAMLIRDVEAWETLTNQPKKGPKKALFWPIFGPWQSQKYQNPLKIIFPVYLSSALIILDQKNLNKN